MAFSLAEEPALNPDFPVCFYLITIQHSLQVKAVKLVLLHKVVLFGGLFPHLRLKMCCLSFFFPHPGGLPGLSKQ